MKITFPPLLAVIASITLTACNSPSDDKSNSPTELTSLQGDHNNGELIIHYLGGSSSAKNHEWKIQAPFRVDVSDHYIDIFFAGGYVINENQKSTTDQTPAREHHLIIKKDLIQTIIYSE